MYKSPVIEKTPGFCYYYINSYLNIFILYWRQQDVR